jgi:hypothetical protein
MVKLHSSRLAAEIHNLKNVLESRGIPCEIRGEHLRGGVGETWTELWIVDDAMKEAAERIMTERGDERTKPWVCPKCKSSVDGGFDQCWKCQAYRP